MSDTDCPWCGGITRDDRSAGVRVAPSQTEVDIDEMQEAVRRALLFVFQAKQMTPMSAVAVIRALHQDGYVIVPAASGVAPSPETPGLREAAQAVVDDLRRQPAAASTVVPLEHIAALRAALAATPEEPSDD